MFQNVEILQFERAAKVFSLFKLNYSSFLSALFGMRMFSFFFWGGGGGGPKHTHTHLLLPALLILSLQPILYLILDFMKNIKLKILIIRLRKKSEISPRRIKNLLVCLQVSLKIDLVAILSYPCDLSGTLLT